MSESLDDIWNEPLLDSPPRTPRKVLFLDDPSDVGAAQDKSSVPIDIDSLFAGLDDDGTSKEIPSSRPFDVNAYRREAEQRAAKEISKNSVFSKYAVQSSSPPRDDVKDKYKKNEKKGKKDDEPKERKPVPKLDENRLLGKDGFPALIRQVKEFKPKGKGHEVSDLNRLMNIYQYWAHQLHPKTQFSDTVQRVERLCRTKRMTVSLHVWKDDFHGTINGIPKETQDGHDSEHGSDDDDDDDAGTNAHRTSQPNRTSRAPSSAPDETERENVSRPPSSVADPLTDDDLFDFDMDAIFDEELELDTTSHAVAQKSITGTATASKNTDAAGDDDVDMWAEFEEMNNNADTTKSLGIATNKQSDAMDDDEDAWAAFNEMEVMESNVNATTKPIISSGAPNPSDPSTAQPTSTLTSGDSTPAPAIEFKRATPTNDEDWDDMYV